MNELQEFTSTLDLDLDIEEKKRILREKKEAIKKKNNLEQDNN